MTTLTRFENDGIEIFINDATGESFMSVSGYARLVGRAKSTISERLASVRLESFERAETLASPSLASVRLESFESGKVALDVGVRDIKLVSEALISEWVFDDNPDVAKQLARLGTRVVLHKMAGYELVDQDKVAALEAQVADLTTRLEHATGAPADWMSIPEYIVRSPYRFERGEMQYFAKACRYYCSGMGAKPKKRKDPFLGNVEMYPMGVLDKVAKEGYYTLWEMTTEGLSPARKLSHYHSNFAGHGLTLRFVEEARPDLERLSREVYAATLSLPTRLPV